MPRYINNSSGDISIVDGSNIRKILKPGEESDTNRYYSITDLDKLSDEPFINPVAEYHIETFSSASDKTIVLTSPDIAKIRIQKVSGLFDVFLQSASNTPAVLQNWTETDYPVDLLINGRCDQIVLRSQNPTGSIQILEISER